MLKAVMSRLAHNEKCSRNFSSSSFVIRVNLLHPHSPMFLISVLLSVNCFSTLVRFYFQASINLKAILYLARIIQNTMIERL